MRGGASALPGGRALAAFAALALLAACDSAGTAPAPPAEDANVPGGRSGIAEPLEEDPRPVVVAFGDSLTAGLGVGRRESYPSLLQGELDRRAMAFRVVNEGVSGDTTARALSRVDAALAHDPEWVILALGANDGLRGLPLDAMEANLERMVERFREGGARVLLAGMMLPRNYGPAYVRDFEAVYPRLAEDLDLPLIPFLLQDVAMVRELNNPDGIHPNAAGNAIVARNVAAALDAAANAAAD